MFDKSHPAVAALVKAFSPDGSWESFEAEFQDLALFVVPMASVLPRGVIYYCDPEDSSAEGTEGWVERAEPSVEWRHENGYGACMFADKGGRVGLMGHSAGSPGASAPGFYVLPV